MYAAGVETPEQLAKLCGVNGRTAGRYMLLEEADMSARIALKLARGLNVRLGWLIDGELPVRLSSAALEAAVVVDAMNEQQARRWLAYGRRILQ